MAEFLLVPLLVTLGAYANHRLNGDETAAAESWDQGTWGADGTFRPYYTQQSNSNRQMASIGAPENMRQLAHLEALSTLHPASTEEIERLTSSDSGGIRGAHDDTSEDVMQVYQTPYLQDPILQNLSGRSEGRVGVDQDPLIPFHTSRSAGLPTYSQWGPSEDGEDEWFSRDKQEVSWDHFNDMTPQNIYGNQNSTAKRFFDAQADGLPLFAGQARANNMNHWQPVNFEKDRGWGAGWTQGEESTLQRRIHPDERFFPTNERKPQYSIADVGGRLGTHQASTTIAPQGQGLAPYNVDLSEWGRVAAPNGVYSSGGGMVNHESIREYRGTDAEKDRKWDAQRVGDGAKLTMNDATYLNSIVPGGANGRGGRGPELRPVIADSVANAFRDNVQVERENLGQGMIDSGSGQGSSLRGRGAVEASGAVGTMGAPSGVSAGHQQGSHTREFDYTRTSLRDSNPLMAWGGHAGPTGNTNNKSHNFNGEERISTRRIVESEMEWQQNKVAPDRQLGFQWGPGNFGMDHDMFQPSREAAFPERDESDRFVGAENIAQFNANPFTHPVTAVGGY